MGKNIPIMKKLFGIVIIAAISISMQAGFHGGFHSHGQELPNDDPFASLYSFSILSVKNEEKAENDRTIIKPEEIKPTKPKQNYAVLPLF